MKLGDQCAPQSDRDPQLLHVQPRCAQKFTSKDPCVTIRQWEMQRRMSNYPDRACCFVAMSESLSTAFRAIVIWLCSCVFDGSVWHFSRCEHSRRVRLPLCDMFQCCAAVLGRPRAALVQLGHPSAGGVRNLDLPRWRAYHLVWQ